MHRAQTSIGLKRKTTPFCQTAAAILTERVEVTLQPTELAVIHAQQIYAAP
jgi:hypothetical protein